MQLAGKMPEEACARRQGTQPRYVALASGHITWLTWWWTASREYAYGNSCQLAGNVPEEACAWWQGAQPAVGGMLLWPADL